ncbi:MAG: hypothetical protein BJ554DRAFT_5835 [Olpidium bornovanus]|uniref:Uncharacterized protein n=1 Tax=Olpidium bornovanus TaxID=278681 RepID=A0A8H8DKQ4_9FUNG|nr:MAG: hypothetical protein BJ554DRAFT_5835 [Olpidium bornovanus]
MGILDLSARAQSLRLTGGMLIGAYLRADRIDAANAVRALLAGLGVSLKVNTIVDYLAYYARTGLVTERDRLLDEVRSSSDYRLSDGNLNTLIMSAFRGAPDDGSHMTPIARLQTAQFWLDMLQQGSRTATAQPGTAMPASPRITAPNYCRLIQAYGNVALLLEENPGIAAAFDTAIGAGMSDFVEMEARTSADSGFRFAVPGSTGSPVSADESLAGAGCRTADAAVRSESRGTLTAEKCRERGRSLLDDALVQGLPLPAGVVAPLLRALKNSGIDVLADSRFRMLWRACEPQAVTE